MPITGPNSYPPTMQDFVANWSGLDSYIAIFGDTPLVLSGDYDLETFTNARAEIVTALNYVVSTDNTAQTLAGNLAAKRAALRPRIIQFRRVVLGFLPNTGYARALPDTPPPSAAESKFLGPFQDTLVLWAAINADATLTEIPRPLLLTGGYTQANFAADLTALRALFVSSRTANENAQIARRRRDALLKPATQRMKQYRDVVIGRYQDTPYAQNLPLIWPADGSTPAPVTLAGGWNPAQSKAVFNWTASDNPRLERYSLRCCTGKTYRVANEFVVADFAPGTLSAATATGLPAPGTDAVYRLYVVLTTGNERGSNNAAVSRPI